jgi:hypothetical protein
MLVAGMRPTRAVQAAALGITPEALRLRLRHMSEREATTKPRGIYPKRAKPACCNECGEPSRRDRQRCLACHRARPRGRRIEHAGESLTVQQWATRLGITARAVWHRLRVLPVEQALTRPVQQGRAFR